MKSIMEATSWSCACFQEDYDRISDLSLVMQETKILEALNYDIDVPCVLQWMWALEREMEGWELDLLLENEDDRREIEPLVF